MIGRLLKRAVLIGGVCGVAVSAQAQQRPLVTEDPETIGAGFVLIEAGFDYGRDEQFTVSGLTGTLLRVPAVGLSIGVSSICRDPARRPVVQPTRSNRSGCACTVVGRAHLRG